MPPRFHALTTFAARHNHLRARRGHEHNRVTFVELFFDLVFVFAVTQLSHGLLEHLTLLGALQTGLLMMAVWWAWIDTTWITNWLDPERPPVRLLLFALMLAGLVLSASIPKAFENRALPLALAYVLMQTGRNLFMLWALRASRRRQLSQFPAHRRLARRDRAILAGRRICRCAVPARAVGRRGRN